MNLNFTEDQLAALQAEVDHRNTYNAEHNPDHEEVTVENMVELEVGALIRGYAESANGRHITEVTDAIKEGNSSKVSELSGRRMLSA